jgi:hypothetical protein
MLSKDRIVSGIRSPVKVATDFELAEKLSVFCGFR